MPKAQPTAKHASTTRTPTAKRTAKRTATASAAADLGLGHLSSGNVFADLGFEDPSTALLKADLVIALGDVIKRNGLTQAAAAARLGTTQPKMSLLLRGRAENVSAEKLMEYLTLMDRQVHIVVTPAAQPGAHRSPPKVIVGPKPWEQNWIGSTPLAATQAGRFSYAAKKSKAVVKGGLYGNGQPSDGRGRYAAKKSVGTPGTRAKPTPAR